MVIKFIEVGSKKLLKRLNVEIIPRTHEHVTIGHSRYYVSRVNLLADMPSYEVWLVKLKKDSYGVHNS